MPAAGSSRSRSRSCTVASTSRDERYLDFLIECFNHEISGLDDVEVWVHTCWGNANMQRVHGRTSYAEAIEIFLERVGGDVWTVEMKDRQYADLEPLPSLPRHMRKKLALGVVSHRSLQVETPRRSPTSATRLSHVDADKLVLTSDCGFGRGGPNRLVAFGTRRPRLRRVPMCAPRASACPRRGSGRPICDAGRPAAPPRAERLSAARPQRAGTLDRNRWRWEDPVTTRLPIEERTPVAVARSRPPRSR